MARFAKMGIGVRFAGNRVTLSARRQDRKKDMGKLLHDSVYGLPDGNGGGHVPAAGASLLRQDYPEFKKRLLENHG